MQSLNNILFFLQLAAVSLAQRCRTNQTGRRAPTPSVIVHSSCNSDVAKVGGTDDIDMKMPTQAYTGEIYANGSADYFSDCTYSPPSYDLTPSQRNIRVKTDCLIGNLPLGWAFDDNTKRDERTINFFCSPIANGASTFYDQVPRSTLLATPPKCDPTFPNSPGSREFFMQMVNTWRDIAILPRLQFNDCLATRSNRNSSGHAGFQSLSDPNTCKPEGCTSGSVREAAFGSSFRWNWWRRLTIPMCSFLGDQHRSVFLHEKIREIGYYETWNGKDGYYFHVQSC